MAMAYALLSPKDVTTAHEGLWTDRTVQGEVDVIVGRTLADDIDSRLKPGSRILEAGCGLGGWVRYLQDRGHDIHGVDFEESIVARVRADDPSLQVSVGDVEALDFPDQHFDAYISLGVVEHFIDGPDRALTEAYRVLKPGGLAFVTVPYLNTFRRLISHPTRDLYFALLSRTKPNRANFWEYRYTEKEMTDFLQSAGFEIVATNIDDYKPDLLDRHIGLYADFFFLREKRSPGYRLNRLGRGVLRVLRRFPHATSSGILVVGRKPG